MTESIRTECLRDEADFHALAADWNRLAEATAPDSVFLRHEWFDSAWQWLKSDCRLWLICIYRGDTLAGICPLVSRSGKTAAIRVSRLEFLTVPDTQECDILSSVSDRNEVIAAVARKLHEMRSEWDVLELSYLPAESDTLATLPTALAQYGLLSTSIPAGRNLYIALDGSWENFYAARSRSLKKASNLAANRLNKSGKIDLRQVGADANDAAIGTALEAAVRISSQSWKRQTGLTLDHPGPAGFIRRLTKLAHERGWLAIWLLEVDGKAVSMEYQLAYADRVHALRADFDDAWSELSPGSHLNREMLEQMFGGNRKRYYMGPGDNAYKLRWAEDSTPLYRVLAYSTTPRGWLAYLLDRKLRPAFDKLRSLISRQEQPA